MENCFPSSMHDKLGYYVYRLIDPRDGSTFYVGKGKGNRVFQHVKGTLDQEAGGSDEQEDHVSAKIKTILQIKLDLGVEPIHVIHRHGLTEEEALHVEAALIDTYPGLSNIAGGHGSSQFGPANAMQLIRRYEAQQMSIKEDHLVMAINVARSSQDTGLYNAVRCAWRISVTRANKAKYVFAVLGGICKEVFEVTEPWLPATLENFPGLLNESVEGRYGFVGRVAEPAVRDLYVDKRLPEKLQRRKGMASPILYNYQ